MENKRLYNNSRRKNYDSVLIMKTPRSKGSWRLWVLGLIFLLILGGSVYLLFFSDYFKVKDVKLEGGTPEMWDDVNNIISWETDYMILFNTNAFAQTVKSRHDDLADVLVVKSWPHTIEVTMLVEEPKLVWNSGGQLYLLNGSGIALNQISEQDRLEKYMAMPVVGDLSGLPVDEDVKVVSREFVEFLYQVKSDIENSLNKQIEAFEIAETTFELRVRLKDGFEVYFDTLRNPHDQVEKLNIFLNDGILVNEYIDLRVPGKVYYK